MTFYDLLIGHQQLVFVFSRIHIIFPFETILNAEKSRFIAMYCSYCLILDGFL